MANESRGLFGRIAVSRGFLSPLDLEAALRAQAALGDKAPSLGALLVQRRLLTLEQVSQIMALQREYEARQPPAPAVPAAPTAPVPPPPPPPPQGPPPVTATATPPNRSGHLALVLEAAEKKGASDVHFHAGAPLAMRVDGRLGLTSQTLDRATQERALLEVLTSEQRRAFDAAGELDFALTTPGGLRVRGNVYRTHGGLDATFRLLRRRPESFEALGLPNTLAKLVGYHQGLVLVTGPAGSGKSTTLAALVDLVNEDRAEHVLSLEDPIEILHPVKKALVNQRQIARDTESYARALRGALREDPDVIVIGELRDRESISLSITAAETGHLVIGTMQTNSASRTVSRLVDAFPPAQQGQVRSMLSESLRGIVTQRLVPGVTGRRVPAVELLFVNGAVANLIRDGKLFQLRSVMQTGRSQGMRSLDDSLRELVQAGKVAPDVARRFAESPATFTAAAPPPSPAPAAAPARPAIRAPPR